MKERLLEYARRHHLSFGIYNREYEINKDDNKKNLVPINKHSNRTSRIMSSIKLPNKSANSF